MRCSAAAETSRGRRTRSGWRRTPSTPRCASTTSARPRSKEPARRRRSTRRRAEPSSRNPGRPRSEGLEWHVRDAGGALQDAVPQRRRLAEDVIREEPRGDDLRAQEGVLALEKASLGGEQRPCHLPTRDELAREEEVGYRAGEHGVWILARIRDHETDHVEEGAARGVEPAGDRQGRGAALLPQRP